MQSLDQYYIDGRWTAPDGTERMTTIDPSTERPGPELVLGSSQDVDVAVESARHASGSWSRSTIADRIGLLNSIAAVYRARRHELAQAIHREMGAPLWLAEGPQTAMGLAHLDAIIEILQSWSAEESLATTRVSQEPIGVCALITPWNWPINQIACKVFPALAAGCTVVLKPSEFAPFSAKLFAEILDQAGTPAGVFNLVHGRGDVVGTALARHRDVRMISITGSNAAGAAVAKNAADTIKRVTQELGGKSPYILRTDSPLADSVPAAVQRCFSNSGQTCTAPTRLLVPRARLREVESLAVATAADMETGTGNVGSLGPLVNQRQFDRAQALIETAQREGARLVHGGTGRPDHLDAGYYVRPTVFSDVTNDMTIAREEIFGPVLSIIGYDDEDHAIQIANDTDYGLAAYISATDIEAARQLAGRLEAGVVYINEAGRDLQAPFGGYKRSGNGREWGKWGLQEFLETKAIIGWG